MMAKEISIGKDLETCRDNLSQLTNERRATLAGLTKSRDDEFAKYTNEKDVTVNCRSLVNKAQRATQIADFNTVNTIESLDTCISTNVTLIESLKGCVAALAGWRAQADTFENQNNECQPNIPAYAICDPARTDCRSKLQLCRTDNVIYTEKYNAELEMHTVCKEKMAEMLVKLEACRGSNITLTNIEAQSVAKISQQQSRLTALRASWNACMSNLSILTTRHEELVKRNEAMHSEIANIKKTCDKAEDDSIDKTIAIIKEQSKANTDAAIATVANSCPKLSMMRPLKSASSQPN
jgi:hypothetical protein